MKWNQMVPELDVFNLAESLHFYTNIIGFKIVYNREEDKFAFLQFEDVQIMIQEIDKEKLFGTKDVLHLTPQKVEG